MNCNCRECEKPEIPLWLYGLAAFACASLITVIAWAWR